jgi:hypothetical protein
MLLLSPFANARQIPIENGPVITCGSCLPLGTRCGATDFNEEPYIAVVHFPNYEGIEYEHCRLPQDGFGCLWIDDGIRYSFKDKQVLKNSSNARDVDFVTTYSYTTATKFEWDGIYLFSAKSYLIAASDRADPFSHLLHIRRACEVSDEGGAP